MHTCQVSTSNIWTAHDFCKQVIHDSNSTFHDLSQINTPFLLKVQMSSWRISKFISRLALLHRLCWLNFFMFNLKTWEYGPFFYTKYPWTLGENLRGSVDQAPVKSFLASNIYVLNGSEHIFHAVLLERPQSKCTHINIQEAKDK